MNNLKTQSPKSKTPIDKVDKSKLGNMIRFVMLDNTGLITNNLLLAREITLTFGVLCTSQDVTEYFKLQDTAEQVESIINGTLH